MIVSDNTIQAEGFSDYFKDRGKSSVKVGEKIAKYLLKNPSPALDSLQQTFLLQLQLYLLEMFYQHYLKRSISIILERAGI